MWDIRATHSGATPAPLATFRGHRHGIVAVAQHGKDVLSVAGSWLGVVSLQAPFTEQFEPVRLSGGRQGSPLVDLAVLPCSRLLVTGTADGTVQICV